MSEQTADACKTQKKKKTVKILKITGFILLCCIFTVLLINSMLCIFVKSYYPTYGGYRLFAIVSDSMEPEIPMGHIIVGRVPESESEIEVGTVITYELKQGKSVKLITHRVRQIHKNQTTGVTTYTTRGDNTNADDGVHPSFSDVVGIYTGQSCAKLGYFVGFLQSGEGAIALIVIMLIIIFTAIMVGYVNRVQVWRNTAQSALNKIGGVLSAAEEEELKTIAEVIGIIGKAPETKQELKNQDKELELYIKTGALTEPDDAATEEEQTQPADEDE